MILLYRILTLIIYPFLVLFTFIRIYLKKEDPKRFREKIFYNCFNVKEKNKSKLIWLHAASLGELRSMLPIIESLNLNNSNLNFLVTTTTLSSANLAKIEFNNLSNVEHRFFPYDVDFLISKFLNLWKPDYIFLIDSEIWPNLMLKAKKLGIPIALVNARLTLKTYKRWMLFPNTAKKIFELFDLCICSNIETKTFLEKLEVKNVYFFGNLKLINQVNEKKIFNVNEKLLSNKRFWFAASTHKGEDLFCIKTHLELKRKFNDVITIIAPRHIERSFKIKLLSEKYKLNSQILNKHEKILEGKELIIINHFGVLQNYFKHVKSVFIGKSMIKKLKHDGGQDPVEAAKLNCKIYHGPYVYNFKEIYEILEKNNISKLVNSFEELSIQLINDLERPYKQKNGSSIFINELGQKTLIDTMNSINNFLSNESK